MAVDRHINFFELQDACKKPLCPLCRIVGDRAERYIDNMLFEHVSDRSFRKAHRLAGGFCDYHSRGLVSFRDGLAVAIMGRDILEDRIISFKNRKPWKPKERCPICVERDRIEVEYLGFIAGSNGESDDEKELRAAFTASAGLCTPHYGKLLELYKKVPKWITDFHGHKFEELIKRVNQFIEFSAYGRQDEFRSLSEKDQVVWKELAVELRGTAD
ncbi:hypothetical protein AGMMS50268_34710 [Spirochaetia bacterium]|nr:hypothetical protein AGMMS50268_34710 [Spirochaetia bacterium]